MTHEELHHQIAQMSEEREQLSRQIVNLSQQLKEEHDILARELGMAGNFVGQIQLLKKQNTELQAANDVLNRSLDRISKDAADAPIHHTTLGCGLPDNGIILLSRTDDISKVTCNQCRILAMERIDKKHMVGLKKMAVDELKGQDKIVISSDGRDWKTFSDLYNDLLTMATKHGMAIVVLP